MPVLADQPDFIGEQRGWDPAQIEIEMPAAPAICIPGRFETVRYRLACTVAPDDLALALKPGDLAFALHSENSSLDRHRPGTAARPRFRLNGSGNAVSAHPGRQASKNPASSQHRGTPGAHPENVRPKASARKVDCGFRESRCKHRRLDHRIGYDIRSDDPIERHEQPAAMPLPPFETGSMRCHGRSILGSRASRKPSPTKLKLVTASVIAAPGRIASQGALVR